jgi:tol-pal system protein YbgF
MLSALPVRALRLLAGTSCLACVLLTPARAELFPDNEARRAVVELRERINSDQADVASRFDKLDQMIQQNTRNQLDLTAQIETLRAELARLRGNIEVLQKDLADTQKRERDLYADVDARIKKVEPQKVVVDGQEVAVEQEQLRGYNAAFDLFRNSQFATAANAFSLFLTQYPQSAYTPLARFWMGNALFASHDFKGAIASHQIFIKTFADHAKVADALVTIGNAQIELGDKSSARKTLREVVDKFSDTQAAQNARDRLAAIK